MRKIILCLMALIVSFNLYAGCDPVADACAPKKELDTWKKSLAFGFNMTQGNSDTSLLTIIGGLDKETKEDIYDIDLTYGYGEDNTNKVDGEDSVTRNDVRFDASYKNLISDRTYWGLNNRFQYDEIAEVDYRNATTPLIGYYLLKDADYKFNLDIGPGYLFERVGGVEDDYLAPRIGQGFEWVISCTSKIYEKMDVTLDVDDSDNYIMLAEVGVEAALNSALSLVVLIRETYDNQPAEDLEKDDLQMISALKVAL